jgi:hypothetical protein
VCKPFRVPDLLPQVRELLWRVKMADSTRSAPLIRSTPSKSSVDASGLDGIGA